MPQSGLPATCCPVPLDSLVLSRELSSAASTWLGRSVRRNRHFQRSSLVSKSSTTGTSCSYCWQRLRRYLSTVLVLIEMSPFDRETSRLSCALRF